MTIPGGLFPIVVHLTLIGLISGSYGDRSPEFTSCKHQCSARNCTSSYGDQENHELGWALRLMGWTCQENCQYTCMHQVTTQNILKNRPIQQFYGKVSL